jgi:glycosyltransferase involved in cell wall biosynthesis
VAQLRAMGHMVETFSVRKSPASELVSDEIRREHGNTEFLMEHRTLARLPLAAIKEMVLSPGRFFAAAKLTLKCAPAGLKAKVWALAYLAEACLLAGRLKAKDVRHLHNHIGENSATVAMLAGLLSGIPYSLTIHGPGEFDQPTLLALDEKIGRAAFVVAVSDYGRSQLFRWSRHADWGKIHVVHCGVDESFLNHPLTSVSAAPRLVCVGRLAEQKGQLLLVEAVAQLMREGVAIELVLVGDGPMRGEIEKLIVQHGLRDRVKIAGWMGSDGVRDQLLGARAMVLPSFAEGLPVVIMEALALGRPVISTYVAGIPELVRTGESGWLVPAGSVPALVAAMREAVTAPVEQLEQMGRAGAALVAERHDAKKEAAKLAALIEASVAGAVSLSPVHGGEGQGEGRLSPARTQEAPHPNHLP